MLLIYASGIFHELSLLIWGRYIIFIQIMKWGLWVVGQSLDLNLVGGALKNPSVQAISQINEAEIWGGVSKLIFFKSCPGDSDLQMQIKMRSRCPDLSTWVLLSFSLTSVFLFSKNKSCHCLHFFFTCYRDNFMGRNFKCFSLFQFLPPLS